MSAGWSVIWKQDGPDLEPHFCREYGCYGTDPDHGMTMEEAVNEIASWYEAQAKSWRDGTHETLKYYNEEIDNCECGYQ